MAAPIFVAAGATSSGTGAISVAWNGEQAGDLGILVVEADGLGANLSLSGSGWTPVTGSPLADLATAAGSRLYVFWKYATSSTEANVSIPDLGDHAVAKIYTFRGVHPTTPIDVTTNDVKTTASTTVTFPSVTTTVDEALVLFIASRPNDSSSVINFGVPVNANLTGLAEAAEAGTTSGNGGGFVLSYGTKATAGAIGTTTMTSNASATNVEFVIALNKIPSAAIDGDLAETVTATDDSTRDIDTNSDRTETVSAVDTQDATVLSTINEAITEAVTATNTQDSVAAAGGSQSETLAAAVAEEAQLDAVADRTEAGAAEETLVGEALRDADTAETVSAADEADSINSYGVAAAETVTATDTQDSTAASNASQSETLTAAVAEEAQLDAVADRTEAGAAEETLVGEALRDADTAETVSAADEADSIISYEVAAEETVTATDSQDFTYAANAEATESVTASDSISCTMSSVRWLLEDNVAFSVYPIRELTMLGGSNTQAVMQAFRAPKTGILGDVAVFLDKANFFGTVPAGLDVNIELWSLATLTGSPQTLLHTRTIPFNSVLTIDQFYSVSFNVSVTQNELYALVIRQPSGASSTTQYLDFGITQLNDSTPTTRYLASIYTTPLKVQPNGSSSWSTLAASYRATTAITYQTAVDSPASQLTSSVFTTEAVSAADEADSTIVYAVDAAEAVTAADSQDFTFATDGLIDESVTASDASTRIKTTNELYLESSSTNGVLLNGPRSSFGGSSGSTGLVVASNYVRAAGIRFVAEKSGALGKVSIFLSKIGNPTGNATIELWQLASASLTALPSSLLATLPVDASKISTGLQEFDLSGVTGASVVAGTGYALVVRGNSAWTSTFSNYLSILDVRFSGLEFDYFKDKANLTFLTFASTWDGATDQIPLISIEGVNGTLDTLFGGFTSSVSTTEAVSASDTSDSTINKTFEVDITEFDDATDFTRAYGPTQNSETVVEELYAQDTVRGVGTYRVWPIEAVTKRQFINTFPASNSGTTTGSGAISVGNIFALRFVANQTENLGRVTLRCRRASTLTSTTPMTVRLCESDGFTTLASILVNPQTIGTGNYENAVFDFSDAAGTFMQQGTTYVIRFDAGADWGSQSNNITTNIYNSTNSPNEYNYLRSLGYQLNSASGLSFNNTDVPLLKLEPRVDQDLTRWTPYNEEFAEITEAVSASDAPDGITAYGTRETLTATDSATYTYVANAWTNNNDFLNYPFVGFGGAGQQLNAPNTVRGTTFIAPRNAVITGFFAHIYRTNTGFPLPTQPGTVELWELASESLTAQPATLIASTTWNLANLNTPSSNTEVFLFDDSQNPVVAAGKAYAVLFRAGSDWSNSTQFASVVIQSASITTYSNSFNAFRSSYRNISGPGPSYTISGLSSNTNIRTIYVDSDDSSVAGFDTASDITEAASAADESDSTAFQNNLQDETLTATDSSDNIVATNAAAQETATAEDTSDNTLITDVAITEAESATDSPTCTYDTNAELAEAEAVTDDSTCSYATGADRAETAAAADDATVLTSYLISASEAVMANDAPTATYNTFSVITEAVSADDSSFNLVVFDGLLTETLTAADSVDTTLTAVGLATETLSAADSINRAIVADVDIQETLATTDTQNSVFRSNNQTIESAAATDSPESINTVRAHNTEGGVLVDTIYNTASSNAQSSNSFGIEFTASKTTSIRNVTVRMRRSLSDQPDPTLELWQGATLVASMAISYNSISTSSSNYVVEVGGLGFNIVSGLQYSIRINATNTSGIVRVYYSQLTNTNTTAFSPWYVNLSATAGITNFPAEPLQINLFRLLEDVVVDAADSGLAQSGSISEATSGSDTQASQVDFIASGSEPLSATDQTNSSRVSSHAADETVSGSDSQVNFVAFVSDRTESVSATEDQASQAIFVGQASDDLTILDTLAAQANFVASRPEVLTVVDSLSALLLLGGQVVEVAAANDSVFSQLILTVEVVDPLAASDSALGGLSTLASASALVLAAVDGDLLYTPFIDLEYVLTGSLAADVEDGYVQTLVDLDYSEAVINDSQVAISQDIDYINAYAKPDYIQMSVEVVQPNTVEYVEYVRLAGAA